MIFLPADCYRQSDRGDIELPVHQGVAAAELSQSYVARKDRPTVPQRHLIRTCTWKKTPAGRKERLPLTGMPKEVVAGLCGCGRAGAV